VLKRGRKAIKGSRVSRVANGQDDQDGLDVSQDTEGGQVSAFVQRGDTLTGIVRIKDKKLDNYATENIH